MKTSIENTASFEQQGFGQRDVPRSHMEGIDPANLEGLHRPEKNLLIGENYYKREIEDSAGLRGAFEEIAQKGTKEEFASFYEQYVDSPHELKEKSPEVYEFLRDRVFYGREYGLSGMEAFMNRTAPERTGVKDHSLLGEGLLPRNEINDREIRNCEHPFSYGDVNEIAEKADTALGNIAMLPIAANRMMACSRLMVLCGMEAKDVSSDRGVIYATDQSMIAYDPLYMKGFNYEQNSTMMPDIIKGLSGIETEMSEHPLPAEEIADKLDHGHRGIVTFNEGILNGWPEKAKTGVGKLAANLLNSSANQAATLLCAVRDGGSGEVRGFYLAGSKENESCRYVEADQLMNAMDVKHSGVLFTKHPYPDE